MPLKITRSFKTYHGPLRGPDRFPYVGVSFNQYGGQLIVLFFGENRGVALEPRRPHEEVWAESDFFPLAEPIIIENDITVDS